MLNYKRIVLLVIVFPGLIFAQPEQISSDSATASGAEAKVLYQKYCSVCHGDSGNGDTRVVQGMDPQPRDFTSPDTAMLLTRERMILSVSYGRPGTAMVAHGSKLTRLEIEGIVDYIRDKFMRTPVGEQETMMSPALAAGQKIYARHCSVCHGDKGNSSVWTQGGLNPAPRNFTQTSAQSELSRDRMIHSVTQGRRGTAMMPFSPRLSAQEIEQVVNYIRVSFMGISSQQEKLINSQISVDSSHSGVKPAQSDAKKPHPVAPTKDINNPNLQTEVVDMAAPMPFSLVGDSNRGQEFFMHNCHTCHGKNGKGDGPRSSFIFPPPRNFTDEFSRGAYNRPRLYTAISAGKTGTVMPAWNKVLSRQQIADVAEFVFRAFIQAVANPDLQQQDENQKSLHNTEKKS